MQFLILAMLRRKAASVNGSMLHLESDEIDDHRVATAIMNRRSPV
jgi:hypothetical protein